MREVMNSLIDPVAKNGKCDLATDICDPYQLTLIGKVARQVGRQSAFTGATLWVCHKY
jgi:hypothetical protein